MLDTPVLFLIFNRPDTTVQVFDRIRQAAPRQLFIAADGPRPDNADDMEKCRQVREIVGNIDWECEVKTLFRSENLGCGLGPAMAITWFFKNVEQGIILEDDCLPDVSFFAFCEQMLIRYADEEKITMISGNNFLFSAYDEINSYYFSTISSTWGWATWKRVWLSYKFSMDKKEYDKFIADKVISELVPDAKIADWIKNMFSLIPMQAESQSDAWDYQFLFLRLKLKSLSVVPYRNLIKNIGYAGTHFQRDNANPFLENMAMQSISVNDIIHPLKIQANKKIQNVEYQNIRIYYLQDTRLNKIREMVPKAVREFYRKMKKMQKKGYETVSN